MQAEDRLIVALDKPTEAEAMALVSELKGTVRWLKVGLVLFSLGGPELVRRLVRDGWNVFLDLKLHDVPHQVGLTVGAVADLGASLLTIHTSGGQKMMESAAMAADGSGTAVIGVTVLTSLDQALISAVGVDRDIASVVPMRARLAQASGLAGVVSSPLEASAIRAEVGSGFEIVTPGIRPATVGAHDQKRIATPQQALESGASRLVVGRAITSAADPAAAAAQILASIR